MQMAKQHVSDGEDTGARGVDSADASVRQPNGLQPDRLEVRCTWLLYVLYYRCRRVAPPPFRFPLEP